MLNCLQPPNVGQIILKLIPPNSEAFSHFLGEPNHDWPNKYLPVDYGKSLPFIL